MLPKINTVVSSFAFGLHHLEFQTLVSCFLSKEPQELFSRH